MFCQAYCKLATINFCKCSFLHFLQEKIPFTDPKYFKDISKDTLAHILRSETDTEIPLLDKRLEVLHEAGTVLCDVS